MVPRTPSENLKYLEGSIEQLNIDLISSTRIVSEARSGFHPAVREISRSLDNAVVLGVRLSRPVLETVISAPTWTYYHHYRMVNFSLDQAALHIAGLCQRSGFGAFPVPASQILDWDRLRAHLSHKELGMRAGLGWRGRNNLLVNPLYGSQVRYVSVLTDMPLPDGSCAGPQEGCKDCYACLDVCPVGAIHEDVADFELDRCAAQLRRFSKSEKLNTMICGLCVKVCGGSVDARRSKKDNTHE